MKFKKKPTGQKLKKVEPQECPYIDKCEEKVLEDEYKVLCKDMELSPQIEALHMTGQHTWSFCPIYKKFEREVKGKLPKEWKKLE